MKTIHKMLFLAFLLIISLPFASADFETNLFSVWSMNDSSLASGNRLIDPIGNMNGVYAGVDTGQTSVTNLNASFNFDSNSDQIVNTTVASPTISQSEWTISFWASTISDTTFRLVASDSFHTPTNGFKIMKTNTDAIRVDFILAGVGENLAVTNGSWTTGGAMAFYVFVANDNTNTLTVYKDGVRIQTLSATKLGWSSADQALYVGRNTGQASQFWSGKIDEFTFWQRSLNATEVEDLYNSGDGCGYPYTLCTIQPAPTLTLKVTNVVNGTQLSGFCVDFDNGTTTTLCNNTGTQINYNITGIYNISWYNISGNTYFNQSLTNYNFSATATVTANTSQSRLFVRVSKLFLDTLIQNYTITNDQVANNTNSYGLFIPANNASNNLMATVTGNYTLNQSCTSPLLGNGNCTISGVYDFRLNLSANNGTTALTNYTYVVYNSTLGLLFNNFTTTHLNVLNLLQGYHYDVNLSKSGFVKNTTTINANTSNIAYNATLKPIQIDITFRDEQNRTLLPGVNITTIIIESDGTQNVYYTNTSSLTLNGLFPPGSYTLRYGATGYSLRDYYFNLTAADANLTLYLIIDSVYSPGIVEVRDYDGTVVPDAIVRMIRFYGDPTVPSTVQMGTTNNDGEAVFVAEVVTSFYLWEVEVDGELRYNTSVPELLVLESDGLWHKTFVLSQGASTARSRYTGYTYNFRPEGALANNTRIEFTFNITSSYWNMTSCTFELRNTSGSVLNTTSVTCGASLGNLSLYYTPTANLVAYATISTLYHTNEYQQAYNVYYSDAGNYTFQTLIDDIDAFSGSGFNTQSKFILSIVFIIIIVLGVSRATDLISSPEETLFLIFVLSVLFSYADWLHLPINSPFPAAEQYMVSIILGIVWLVAYWRKEGIAQ